MSETQENTEANITNTDDLDAFSTNFFGQKESDTSPTSDKSADQDTDDEDGGSVSTEAQEDKTVDPNEDPEAEYVEEKPKKKTVQDRIDEVIRQREDLKRASEAEIAKLRQEFEDFKKGATKAPVQAETKEPTPDDLGEDGEPKYALGEFDPKYIKDLTHFTIGEETSRVHQAAADEARNAEINQSQQAMQTTWNTKLEDAKTAYPDLIEKGTELLNGFNDLPMDYAGYLTQVLMSMDNGPDVLYYLSNNPDEARTIVNSGAQKATLALGRIEAKFVEAAAKKQLAKPKVSSAPPPPANNERARGTNGAFISVAGDTEDLDAFSREFFKKK